MTLLRSHSLAGSSHWGRLIFFSVAGWYFAVQVETTQNTELDGTWAVDWRKAAPVAVGFD
jgi:hypothetical protein